MSPISLEDQVPKDFGQDGGKHGLVGGRDYKGELIDQFKKPPSDPRVFTYQIDNG